MENFQSEKNTVRTFYKALDNPDPASSSAAMAKFCDAKLIWRGFHPFHELHGPEAVAEAFWSPLKTALRPIQHRMDMFFAGKNEIDGFKSVWVASMGHLMGLLDKPWLGIRPTSKIAMLRYAAFHKVENGKITETAMFFDIPHLMMQAGLNPFPPQTAAQLVQPGPMTHDALLYEAQPPETGEKTLAAINYMANDIKKWSGGDSEPLEDELRRSWHEDMLWWGPTGIGATYTIKRYAEQHSGPFRAAFVKRQFNGHLCRMAEGHFGGFFGWPNLTLENRGGFMGMPATGQKGDMRVIDMYRRDGDKLAENWIFIDLLHFWNMQGVDILKRTVEIS